jgi:tetratricopeptide (TPR) repeat protein
MKSIVPSVVLLIATFGAADSPAAQEFPRGENPAVLALLDAADRELGAQRPDQASLLLERALRIEPSNAAAWDYLGRARLEQGQHAQAEAMAAKAKSLAPNDERPVFSAGGSFRTEPASTYVDTLQPSGRRRAPEAAIRSPAGRRADDAYAEHVRRQRAARQGRVQSRSAPEIEQRRDRANVTAGLEI